MNSETRQIPIKQIKPSKENPRKKDGPADKELKNSIAQFGLLQAIGVRDVTDGGSTPSFEIIFGERRWTQCKALGLETMACQVFDGVIDPDDMRLVENAHRLDMHPMDEAEIYERAVERHGGAAEAAKMLAKSPTVVRKMLELTRLGKEARTAFRNNEFRLEHAFAISTVKDPEVQDSAVRDLQDYWGELPTGESLKAWTEALHLDLADAEWSLKDDTLGPACETCPDRSKNDNLLFEDMIGKKDVCRKKECFVSKRRQFGMRRIEQITKKGGTLIEAKDTKGGWFRNSTRMADNPSSKWLSLDATIENEKGRRVKVRTVFKEELKKLKTKALVHPDSGFCFEVIERKKLYPESGHPPRIKGSAALKPGERPTDDRSKREDESRIDREANNRFKKKMLEQAGTLPANFPAELLAGMVTELLDQDEEIVQNFWDEHDMERTMSGVADWIKKGSGNERTMKVWDLFIQTMAWEVLCSCFDWQGKPTKTFEPLAKALRLDPKKDRVAVRKQVVADCKALAKKQKEETK